MRAIETGERPALRGSRPTRRLSDPLPARDHGIPALLAAPGAIAGRTVPADRPGPARIRVVAEAAHRLRNAGVPRFGAAPPGGERRRRPAARYRGAFARGTDRARVCGA